MLIKSISILFCILFLSCGQSSENQGPNIDINKNRSTDSTLKQNLIGKWGGLGEKPVFEIRKDSIYYFNRDSSYPYRLMGDTFGVKFPDRDTITEFGKVRVVKDTLMITEYANNNFVIRGYRYKD